MAQKKKFPLWLGLVLALLLLMLLVVVLMAPQTEVGTKQPGSKVPNSPVVETPAPAAKYHEKVEEPSIGGLIEALPPEPAFTQSRVNHGLALIIDDVGYNMTALKKLLALSVPVAISVLPEGPVADQSARLAHQAGQVVMLHLPMQPVDPSLQMTESFLLEGMSEETVRDIFLRDMARVPFAEGVNNHMGSRLTQLEEPMRQVMQLCREHDLFYVDSKTSSLSVAAREAESMGVNWASRHFFLDHVMDPDAMAVEWERARACVRKGRRCIIIAHPRAASVAFLENNLTKEDAANMVSIRQLLRGDAANVKPLQQPEIVKELH
ncbi:MAG: divergent polysaccharide deacetylase family protein [Mariprofundus sp.]